MRLLKTLVIVTICLILPVVVFAHPGGTDSDGGHYDRSTGEYHYHHGYPEHQHYDTNGDGVLECPYQTSENKIEKPKIDVQTQDTDDFLNSVGDMIASDIRQQIKDTQYTGGPAGAGLSNPNQAEIDQDDEHVTTQHEPTIKKSKSSSSDAEVLGTILCSILVFYAVPIVISAIVIFVQKLFKRRK